jgi:ATP-binding cassette subfamily B protein
MIKRFAGYFRPHMHLFILDMFFAFLIAAIDLVFPVLSRQIVNDFIPNQNLSMLVRYSLIALGLFVVRMFGSYVVGYWGHIMGARIEVDMKRDLFTHMQKLHHKFFDKNRTGQIMNRFTGDLFEVAELAHHGPEDLFISAVMLIGSFFILLTINVSLTLIVFSFIVLLIIFTLWRRIAMLKAFRTQKARHADLNSKLENSVTGIRLAKAFSNESYEQDRFEYYNRQYYESKGNSFFQMSIFMMVNGFLTDLLNLAVIAIGGYFVYMGWIQIGDLLAYILYVSFMLKPVRRLMEFTQQLQLGLSGLERFGEIMDTDPEIVDAPDAVQLDDIQGAIEFDRVSFRYDKDDSDILKDFSLRIKPGEKVALVGASGVGKTTIAQLIPRFYEIQEGAIRLDGRDIRSVKLSSLRDKIGIVSQDVLIFYGTIKENILYGRPDATDEEVWEAAKRANIHNFILSLDKGYETIVGERGIMLSGGQKQRLSIARLFLKNPDILILDEATSALDNENEAIVQRSLEALARGRTSVVIAHRLSTLRSSDRIIVLDQGRIAEEGTEDELLERKGIYWQLRKLGLGQSDDVILAAESAAL